MSYKTYKKRLGHSKLSKEESKRLTQCRVPSSSNPAIIMWFPRSYNELTHWCITSLLTAFVLLTHAETWIYEEKQQAIYTEICCSGWGEYW